MMDFIIGALPAVVGYALGAVAFVLVMKGDIRVINVKIDAQSKELAQLGQLIATSARFEERLSAMRRELDELKHGEGFVLPINRSAYEKP